MQISSLLIAAIAGFSLFITGCTGAKNGTAAADPHAHHAGSGNHDSMVEREENFAELEAHDRSLAAAQGYCTVTSEPLGSMGPPIKVMVNDQAVFVCCKGCVKKATSDPEKTLAKVAELKAKVKSERAAN